MGIYNPNLCNLNLGQNFNREYKLNPRLKMIAKTSETSTLADPYPEPCTKSSVIPTEGQNANYSLPESNAFERTLQFICSTEGDDDLLRYGVAIFDTGSTYNYVTLEWLHNNHIPYMNYEDGPRVVAESIQGCPVYALGEIKDVRFSRSPSQREVLDSEGTALHLLSKFWYGDFFVLYDGDENIQNGRAQSRSIEVIIGSDTMNEHDLYRPHPQLLMTQGYYMQSYTKSPNYEQARNEQERNVQQSRAQNNARHNARMAQLGQNAQNTPNTSNRQSTQNTQSTQGQQS
ncbi:hypothetical protein EJ05DRAFT_499109 [Pseudovirgaria hyperparasitica]|uniref:Uncharacterized protein n=1 Tax=Pseudovirgaria hyperparasitica TaxID=470096 RepID=A0A6A6WDI3_9PEZI|nr:uncharacterized protein EJ05DRAFT_499109 [Pseudovirgaria hyperparasitica]KAF2759916.1 hypothetical protein EJ05DRAFT_499109 [Pseudovirgaria hyperparasitica]